MRRKNRLATVAATMLVLVALPAAAGDGPCSSNLPITPGSWHLVSLPCDPSHVIEKNPNPTAMSASASSQIDTNPAPNSSYPRTVSWSITEDAFDSTAYDVTLQGPLAGTQTLHINGTSDPSSAVVPAAFFATEGKGNYTLIATYVAGAGSQVQINRWSIDIPIDAAIGDIFADDFNIGDYGVRWGFFTWVAPNSNYAMLPSGAALVPGVGYWFKSLDPGSLTVSGTQMNWDPNWSGQYPFQTAPLEAGSPPHSNLIGHPFLTATPATTWDSVQVDGTADPVSAEGNGWVSAFMYKWNGAGYDTYDAAAGGAASGEFYSWDGYWVKALSSGHFLDISDPCGCCICLSRSKPGTTGGHPAHFRDGEWAISLVAESGSLRDGRNLVGQLRDAADGHDSHDTDEPAPFGSPNLTIVFPRGEWGVKNEPDFNADFRAAGACRGGRWPFEVRSSEVGKTISIRWENSANAEDLLEFARLRDVATGEILSAGKAGRWSFVFNGEARRLIFETNERDFAAACTSVAEPRGE